MPQFCRTKSLSSHFSWIENQKDNLTQLCVIVPSLASHQTSSLGEQPPQHPRLWFGFARYVLYVSLDGVCYSKQAPLFVPFSCSISKTLFKCPSPLSSLCSFSHCPCCGQLLIVHHVVTSVPATVIADVTAKIGGDVFKAEWSTCVFDIITHHKGFPASITLLIGKSKGRCAGRAQDRWWCVK